MASTKVDKTKKESTKKNTRAKKIRQETQKLDLKVSKTVQRTIPYENVYKNGIIEAKPGLFTKSYPIRDINFQTSAQEEQEDIFIKYGDLLNSFENVHLQITINNKNMDINTFKQKVFLKHKQDVIFSDKDDKEEMRKKGLLLNELRDEYNEMLEEKISAGRNNIEKEKYLTVGVKADNIDMAVNSFARIDSEVSAKLKRIIKEETTSYTIQERLNVMHNVFNLGSENLFNKKSGAGGRNGASVLDLDWIHQMGITTKDVVGPMDFTFEKDYFKIGEKYARVLFLKTIPTFLSTDFLSDITNIPINMMTSVHFEGLNQNKGLNMVKTQMTNINGNVVDAQKRASRSGYDPSLISPELLRSQEESNKLLGDMTSRNQKLFIVTLVVMHFADDEVELDTGTDMIKSAADKHLCTLEKLTLQQELGMATALPLCYNRIYTNRLLTTESASVFIPFEVKELTQERGMYYGLNAVSKNMILFNRVNSKNQNGLILGTPGSGKSFSSKREIVNVFLNTNDEIYIIDPEREYAPLVELLGGEIIRIAAGSNFYINPMDMDIEYADKDNPVTMKSSFIIGLCEVAVGGRYGLTPIQKSIIDRCVTKLYTPYVAYLLEHNLKRSMEYAPTLEDFYNLLLNQPEAEAQELAIALEMYCVGSSNLFAHKTNVNLHSRFVVFDIKDIGSLKDIGIRVCLDFVWNKIISNKREKKRTWFYIDEFYILLLTETSAAFLQEIWKRARKWWGVPTGITQNVEDMLASKEGRTIISNSDFVMMLNQAPMDRAELAQMYSMSPTQIEYITNSDSGQGLIYDGKTIIPFLDKFPTDTKLFKAMSTKPEDAVA